MKTILVTGANGFVGSHILQSLQQHAGIKIIAACRDQHKLPAEFSGEVRQGDLRDSSYLSHLLDNVDVICHAAAWTALWGHGQQSKELYLEPSLNLIQAAMKAGVARFINVSTTSASPAHSDDPFSEGLKTGYWPHLDNVINIENHLRELASSNCQMINMRLGLFAGQRYSLGLLPVLLPRLKTHLVPWVKYGKTAMPIVDGQDIGDAFALASLVSGLSNYEAFNIVGPETPLVHDVIDFIQQQYDYPKPHFNVSFPVAHLFATLMEKLDPVVPWEPLVTRSIIHLLKDTCANNQRATERLGYQPKINWKTSVKTQVDLILKRNEPPMKLTKPVT